MLSSAIPALAVTTERTGRGNMVLNYIAGENPSRSLRIDQCKDANGG